MAAAAMTATENAVRAELAAETKAAEIKDDLAQARALLSKVCGRAIIPPAMSRAILTRDTGTRGQRRPPFLCQRVGADAQSGPPRARQIDVSVARSV